jgi:hypothetical protein
VTKWGDLCNILIAATDGRTRGPTKGSAKQESLIGWKQLLHRAANVQAAMDLRAETDEWVQTFLRRVEVVTDWTIHNNTEERYLVVRELHASEWDPTTPTNTAKAVRDRTTGELYFKSSDIHKYIDQGFRVNITGPRLKERMTMAGYEHKVLIAWPAGYTVEDRKNNLAARRRVTVYIVPPVVRGGS